MLCQNFDGIFCIVFGGVVRDGKHVLQVREKSTKINFEGLETAGWGGGFPRKGVLVAGGATGRKVRSLSRKFVSLGSRATLLGVFFKGVILSHRLPINVY